MYILLLVGFRVLDLVCVNKFRTVFCHSEPWVKQLLCRRFWISTSDDKTTKSKYVFLWILTALSCPHSWLWWTGWTVEVRSSWSEQQIVWTPSTLLCDGLGALTGSSSSACPTERFCYFYNSVFIWTFTPTELKRSVWPQRIIWVSLVVEHRCICCCS